MWDSTALTRRFFRLMSSEHLGSRNPTSREKRARYGAPVVPLQGKIPKNLAEQVQNAGAHKGSGQERQQQKYKRQHAKPAMLSVQAREIGNMRMTHCRQQKDRSPQHPSGPQSHAHPQQQHRNDERQPAMPSR